MYSLNSFNFLLLLTELELNVAAIYALFSDQFPEDAVFWRQVCKEEQEHAALLLNLSENLPGALQETVMPPEAEWESVAAVNRRLVSLLAEYRTTVPDKVTAYCSALQIEQAAGECHYQLVLDSLRKNANPEGFKILKNGDVDHANRIKALLSLAHEGAAV